MRQDFLWWCESSYLRFVERADILQRVVDELYQPKYKLTGPREWFIINQFGEEMARIEVKTHEVGECSTLKCEAKLELQTLPDVTFKRDNRILHLIDSRRCNWPQIPYEPCKSGSTTCRGRWRNTTAVDQSEIFETQVTDREEYTADFSFPVGDCDRRDINNVLPGTDKLEDYSLKVENLVTR